jgi:putative membrane protein
MELTIVLMNVLYAVLGVVLMYLSYRTIDALSPRVNFEEELRKGNVAVAIVVGAMFLAIAVIIGGALN